jgi:hypothetical protein
MGIRGIGGIVELQTSLSLRPLSERQVERDLTPQLLAERYG